MFIEGQMTAGKIMLMEFFIGFMIVIAIVTLRIVFDKKVWK